MSRYVFPYLPPGEFYAMTPDRQHEVTVKRRFAGNLNALGRRDIINPTYAELEIEGWVEEAMAQVSDNAGPRTSPHFTVANDGVLAQHVPTKAQHPGAVARDEALARVEENAEPNWMKLAIDVVRELARTHASFTTDAVWKQLEGTDAPHEPRALGAIMQKAVRSHWVEATNTYLPSDRPECHRRPVRVWASLLIDNP